MKSSSPCFLISSSISTFSTCFPLFPISFVFDLEMEISIMCALKQDLFKGSGRSGVLMLSHGIGCDSYLPYLFYSLSNLLQLFN